MLIFMVIAFSQTIAVIDADETISESLTEDRYIPESLETLFAKCVGECALDASHCVTDCEVNWEYYFKKWDISVNECTDFCYQGSGSGEGSGSYASCVEGCHYLDEFTNDETDFPDSSDEETGGFDEETDGSDEFFPEPEDITNELPEPEEIPEPSA